MSVLGITLTSPQEHAVRHLIRFLDEAAVCYQFSGGFAGNLHGSRWPLHDLDVDVAQQDLPRLAELLHPYISRPLGLYEDAEFRVHLWRAQFEGVDIDVNQAEDAYGRCGGQWVPLGPNLTHRQSVPLFDLHVWVQPLDALIAYKALIGRSAEVADLRALQHHLRACTPGADADEATGVVSVARAAPSQEEPTQEARRLGERMAASRCTLTQRHNGRTRVCS